MYDSTPILETRTRTGLARTRKFLKSDNFRNSFIWLETNVFPGLITNKRVFCCYQPYHLHSLFRSFRPNGRPIYKAELKKEKTDISYHILLSVKTVACFTCVALPGVKISAILRKHEMALKLMPVILTQIQVNRTRGRKQSSIIKKKEIFKSESCAWPVKLGFLPNSTEKPVYYTKLPHPRVSFLGGKLCWEKARVNSLSANPQVSECDHITGCSSRVSHNPTRNIDLEGLKGFIWIT